jgi:tRNA threonylcarbamoyl adenosine modification protein YeaZ
MTTCLALEFSSERRSAAVARDGLLLSEAWVQGGTSTSAPGLIAEALSKAGVQPADVTRLVVGLGPGSYTGIRRAIATFHGWHLALGTPVARVGSMDLLASLAHDAGHRDCLLASDAQRGEWACGEMRDGPLRLLGREQVIEEIARGRRVVTPDRGLEGAVLMYPTAALAATLGHAIETVRPQLLEPVYLREAAFQKAPPARHHAQS